MKTILGITHAASRLAANVNKCIEAWKSYSHFWKLDAQSFVADLQVLDFAKKMRRLFLYALIEMQQSSNFNVC